MRASVVRLLVLASAVLLGAVVLADHDLTGAACAVGLLVVAALVRDPVVTEQQPGLPTAHLPVELDVPVVTRLDELAVGTDADGRLVHLDATAGIVVIGHGALAVGVFTALAAALSAAADDTHDVRLAAGDDIALPASRAGVPDSVAVAVVLDESGFRVASVVLVPDLRTLPRRPASTVEVSRYGCSVRADPDAPRGVAVVPALPALEPLEPLESLEPPESSGPLPGSSASVGTTTTTP
ncbi:hypothetical protein ITJ54_01040 [Curtobacterium sp. VKM Ac-2865]|uniref:hypothetical protein n=1 Tax=Curtobacterium sp. VKM Ac-2865 TaxID=2783817 RepID=UPI00188C0931|nr:hypothetical protein [Curtobacterium sp. VKM Ac-2865]MBF4581248.1 hypothetical protein [Curtobacterium sp. VKM Ac-2865]